MSRAPNRRDYEVRQLLDTTHPVVPPGLVARATVRGRRTIRRRRLVRHVLWVLLVAAVAAGIVIAVIAWPGGHGPAGDTGGDGTWWAPVSMARVSAPLVP